jgi:urease accessory protein UreH
VPDSIIPFAHSRFRQRTAFHLSHGAGLFAWEIVAPGRSGEPFAFDDLQVETAIATSGQIVAFDLWRMRPRLSDVTCVNRLSGWTYHATFYVCRAGFPLNQWPFLQNAMAELAKTLTSRNQAWGASALHRDGLVCRGLANEALYLIDGLVRFWRRMKLEIYGCEPVLPRKMY